MSKVKYTGYLEVDGEIYTNQLVSGACGATIKEVIRALALQAQMYIVPKWLSEHHVKYRIYDERTGEETVI